MAEELGNLKTNPALLEALRRATTVKHTARELLEQRVSFIYGSIGEKSGVTRDHIRQALVEREEGTRA